MLNIRPSKSFEKSTVMDQKLPKTQPHKINKTSIINIKRNLKSTHNQNRISTRVRIIKKDENSSGI